MAKMRKIPTGKQLLRYATPFVAEFTCRVDQHGMPVYYAHVSAYGADEAFYTLCQDDWDGPSSPAEAQRQAERLAEEMTEARDRANPILRETDA